MIEEESRCDECGTLSKITNQRFKEYEEGYKQLKEETQSLKYDRVDLINATRKDKQKLEKIDKWFNWAKPEMLATIVHAYEELGSQEKK